MKRKLCIALFLACLLSLSACTSQQTAPEIAQSSMDMSAEPPLSEADLALAVPDFLSDEQQTLYRRAHSLYEHLLGDSIEYEEA